MLLLSTLQGLIFIDAEMKQIGIRSKEPMPALQTDMAVTFLIFPILIFSILAPPTPATKNGDG